MPSFSLYTAAFMSFAVSTLMMLVLFYLRHLQFNARATGAWSAAFACICARHFCSLMIAAGYPVFAIGVDFFLLGFASFLWYGAAYFNDEPDHGPQIMLGFACLSLWIMGTHLTGVDFFWRALPVHLVAGGMVLATSQRFWRVYQSQKNGVYALLAMVIALKGLHLIDFPFLREVANFAPAGFLLGTMLDLSIGLMLLVTVLTRQQDQATQFSAHLQKEMDVRKKAEDVLKERESLFEKVFQLVPDVLVISREKDACYVELNQHWEVLTGFSRSESLGKNALELGLWVDLSQRDQLLNAMETSGEVLNMEATLRHRTGQHVAALISGTCFEVGGESYVMYVVRDISARHQAQVLRQSVELQLREREAVLATVFQLVPDTLTITRMADGHYIDVNRNWEPLSGFSREEAVGHTSSELNLWVDLEERSQMIALILKDGEVRNMTMSFRHKDGHAFKCRVSGSKFETSDGSYLLLSARNIDQEFAAENARIQAENLLRENEQKYLTIFQLSPIPLGLIRTRNAEFVDVNDSWVDKLGYTREETIGMTALEMNAWNQPEEREGMIRTLMTEGKVDRLEIHQRCKDGRILICLLSSRLFVLNGEQMFIFSLLDVTRQYEVEKEIREMTAELEARVRQRTIKLEQANHELAIALDSLKHTQDELIRAEKMAALGLLVAGVAHELNTPIGNSVTVASTLQDKTRDLLIEMAEGKLRKSSLDRYLQNASNGTAILMRTLGVARDLIRSFKQVAVDQSSSQRRQFDLKSALEEVVSTLSPMYKNSPYILEMDLAEQIQMDSFPGPLGQIITNFMTNALSHGFEGRDKGKMRLISKLLDEQHVEVCFSDNGVGIDEADRKHVFDPFFTTKLGQGGSGLGMNIAYNLVTGVLGGTLNLESELGQGSCFTIVLPLSAPELLVADSVK